MICGTINGYSDKQRTINGYTVNYNVQMRTKRTACTYATVRNSSHLRWSRCVTRHWGVTSCTHGSTQASVRRLWTDAKWCLLQNRLKLAAASSRKMYKLEAKCSTLYHFESTFACIWSSIVGSHFLNNFVKVRKLFFSILKKKLFMLSWIFIILEVIVKCHSNHSLSTVIKHLILNISCSIL